MHLAQELVDYIIDFLHNNPEDLKRVSLVSRAWVSRARTHLCESLKITRLKLESLNPSYLTPLCGYVKSLHFTWPMDLTGPPAALDCFGISELHTLTIHSCELHNLNEQIIRQCFATFPCASITTLELHHISPTHRTLLTLLSMFPNVDNLTVSVNRWWADRLDPGPPGSGQNETIQLISLPRLRGSFKLVDSFDQGLLGFHHNNLLRTIATLPLQFQTVTLNFEDRYWMEILSFLNSCSKTVIKVYIVKLPYLNQPIDWPLVNFANLEELHLRVWITGNQFIQHVHPVLRSVVSPCLQRVVVEVRGRGHKPRPVVIPGRDSARPD